VVRPCDVRGEPTGAPLVAADAVGAGLGEVVLIAQGSSARQTEATQNRPVDAVVMAIVDLLDADGALTFRKS
jgi:microcompartment protein CcmK/EutM